MSLRFASIKIPRGAAKQNGLRLGRTQSTMAAVRAPATMAMLAPTITPKTTAALVGAAATASLLLSTSQEQSFSDSHCQEVPSGIFHDPALMAEVKHAATTIRKAMEHSHVLWQEHNQGRAQGTTLVRWIITKEQQSEKIIGLVGDYCLCEHLESGSFASEADCLQALQLHHRVLEAATKAKQSMDLSTCDALDHALEDLAKLYS